MKCRNANGIYDKEENSVKNIFGKKMLSIITAAAIASSLAVIPVSAAFTPPAADTGAAGGISNGGEWSIYASKAGQLSNNGTTITDVTDSKGIIEVTGTTGYSGALQFDLSTMLNNTAAENKVIKSVKLRLTPVVSKPNALQSVYRINDDFKSTESEGFITEFTVPRNGTDDFNKDNAVKGLTGDGLTAYPDALAKWQTDIDITGEAITAGNMLSVHISSNSDKTQKVEYATSNTTANGRLKDSKNPLAFFSEGTNEYSKWLRPQMVFTYTDSETYKNAYNDFKAAYEKLSAETVTESNGITLDNAQYGSDVTLEVYSGGSSPIKVDGNTLVFNDEYVGNDSYANIRLTVSKTDGNETAQYTRVISVPANYTRSNTITFNPAKNPKGEPSIVSGGNTYTDGTAYAKVGGSFTVSDGANIGYSANVTVTDESQNIIKPNADGSYTMPETSVNVSIEYTKKTYGTTRIAAANSVSLRNNAIQGNSSSAPNIVIGADRITFLKFDLSGYNSAAVTDAEISFNSWNTANTKAVFYIPNNDWSEANISKEFCIDGTDATNISNFKYTNDSGADTTVSLLNGENHQALIIPEANDASTAANGILKDFYLGSTGTNKTANFNVTDSIKTALQKSSDSVITLMIYSAGGGNDANSVLYAGSLAARPSLTITESSSSLPDDELITKISTLQELEAFAEIVNGGNTYEGKTVTLENNIDMSDEYNASGKSWIPIGTQDISGTKPFAGTFEGGNHTVSGLYINENNVTQGLFGAVTGNIQNLTAAGEITGGSVAGGIAGWCSGNITNCHSNVNITAQREAGGVVGTLSSGGTASNCTNNGNILIQNKETYAGGITAHNIGGIVKNCSNTGKIENGSDGFRNKIGGIAGYLDNGEIRDSQNSGDVISDAEFASYIADTTQNYVGGLVGYSSYGIITGSTNSGTVRNAVDHAGGAAGFLQGSDLVFECTNSGDVSGKNFVGGIAGSTAGTLSNCRNDGIVTGTEICTGGVAGYLSSGILQDCSYDKILNSELKIVGFNAVGKIANSDESTAVYHVSYLGENAVVSAAQAGDYTLIFAAYDAKGILQRTASQKMTFDDKGKQISTQSFPPNGAKMIKVMLWSNTDGTMTPLCSADTKLF